jgi:hypothetical protein
VNVRAHKRLWTLCIADETKSRQNMKFTIGALKHFKTQAEACMVTTREVVAFIHKPPGARQPNKTSFPI